MYFSATAEYKDIRVRLEIQIKEHIQPVIQPKVTLTQSTFHSNPKSTQSRPRPTKSNLSQPKVIQSQPKVNPKSPKVNPKSS